MGADRPLPGAVDLADGGARRPAGADAAASRTTCAGCRPRPRLAARRGVRGDRASDHRVRGGRPARGTVAAEGDRPHLPVRRPATSGWRPTGTRCPPARRWVDARWSWRAAGATGLVASVTRLVSFGALPPDRRERYQALLEVERAFLDATRAGRTARRGLRLRRSRLRRQRVRARRVAPAPPGRPVGGRAARGARVARGDDARCRSGSSRRGTPAATAGRSRTPAWWAPTAWSRSCWTTVADRERRRPPTTRRAGTMTRSPMQTPAAAAPPDAARADQLVGRALGRIRRRARGHRPGRRLGRRPGRLGDGRRRRACRRRRGGGLRRTGPTHRPGAARTSCSTAQRAHHGAQRTSSRCCSRARPASDCRRLRARSPSAPSTSAGSPSRRDVRAGPSSRTRPQASGT